MNKGKFVFITGGVVSSLGKGITAASLGMLLESRGLRIAMVKFDPYINVDAGTMSPFQHGEVYVTDDGGETDLDLGHYERFTNAPLTKNSNVTTGDIYNSVISRERRGDYDGGCVQIVPHVTDEIKRRIHNLFTSDVDIVLVEIGGTIGDIESLPFIEAARQMALEHGEDNVCFVHLVLVPYLNASQEMKTKPAQHSVKTLREHGIQPDLLVVRCEHSLDDSLINKLSLFCSIPTSSVIEEKDVEFSIYEVPPLLHSRGADALICKQLKLDVNDADLGRWNTMLDTLRNSWEEVNIAVVGKYVDLPDAYKSIYEALTHAGIACNVNVKIHHINSEALTDNTACTYALHMADGILVPGGFGERGIEGKIRAAYHARVHSVPYFGICLGLHCMVIEYARSVLGMPDANSTEFNCDTKSPVICLMNDQINVTNRGGTMRLGSFPCKLEPGTRVCGAYDMGVVHERHRHRFEFNSKYREHFMQAGIRFSGINPDLDLVEIMEMANHPWMVGVQFHPEFRSKPTQPHPLFVEFVRSAHEQK